MATRRSWELLWVAIFLQLQLCWALYAAPAAADRPHAKCSITILGSASGTPQGTIRKAAWDCSGALVTAAAHPALQQLAPTFQGVKWDRRCSTPGCLITLCGNSAVVLHESTLSEIRVPGLSSVLCAVNSSSLDVRSSNIQDNAARAIYAADYAHVTVSDSSITRNWQHNNSGGGFRVEGWARLVLVNTSVKLNWADKGSGGGLFVGGDATAVINSSDVSGNYCDVGNSSQSGSGGGITAVGNASVLLIGNSTVDANIGATGGGVLLTGAASLTIGEGVLFGQNKARDAAYHISARGRSSLNLPLHDFVNQTDARLARISKCSKGVLLERFPCGIGEFRDNRTIVCLCCPERSFSFDTTGVCNPCPAFAACPGGNTLQPLAGYWRSSDTSHLINKCPLSVDACAGRDLCQPGYQGNLCGACALGHGIVSPLRCSRCMPRGVQLGLYVVIALFTVIFVAVTVHYTWKDNQEGSSDLRPSDIIKVMVTFLQYLVIIGSVSVPWPVFVRGMFRASAVVFGAASGQVLSLDCWLMDHQSKAPGSLPRAMQLQLFTFLAPVLVFVAVCALALLWWGLQQGASKVQQALTATSVATVGCGKCTQWALQPLPLQQLWRKLPVTALVVAYYAFPTLLRASLSFFACLHIDTPIDAASVSNLQQTLYHPHGYSVLDIQQQCFVGWHKAWALGLGIPAVLVTCLVAPASLLWLLRSKATSVNDPDFREHFGFLYRNYKPDKAWWEAVCAVQTVLLSVVAAFHFRLEAYYSMLLLCLTFVVSGALQNMYKPYTLYRLHRVHYTSTACLFLTSLGALAMFPVDKQAAAVSTAHITMAVLVLVMDAAFLLYCLHAALTSSKAAAINAWCGNAAAVCAQSLGLKGFDSFRSDSTIQPYDSASSRAGGREVPCRQRQPSERVQGQGLPTEQRQQSESMWQQGPPAEQQQQQASARVPVRGPPVECLPDAARRPAN